jgi:hypothetical protein
MQRAIVIGLLLLSASCSKQVTQATEALKGTQEPQESKLPPAEIAKLGAQGFSLFQCAAYATFADERDKVEPLFDKGRDSLTRFIETGKTIKDRAKEKAVTEKVPIIVLQHLGGPSTDFMVGRVWEATMLYAEDELYNREGWTHQKNDPKADAPDAEIVKAAAAQRFRDANCELL